MPDFLTNLGLRTASAFQHAQIPNYAGHFLIANFLFAHIFSSSRMQRKLLGIDNNITPRRDLGERAERAVRDGKITQVQLDRLRRIEAAHQNNIENYPNIVAALCLAVAAGLDNQTVNKYGLIYTLGRIAYTFVYATNTTAGASAVRSVLFWVGNVTCIRLLWFAGKAINSRLNL
ncbi:hypothetical protein AAFC00_000286 [Neodothiora populina]|uniref:Membrane-associated, eicosanoid/glutathione metabolism (MAPEG) protein n=1 Tax=Neodothiora populina TaxID=2781224 RepID=A0ABR3PCD5_9PEZI